MQGRRYSKHKQGKLSAQAAEARGRLKQLSLEEINEQAAYWKARSGWVVQEHCPLAR